MLQPSTSAVLVSLPAEFLCYFLTQAVVLRRVHMEASLKGFTGRPGLCNSGEVTTLELLPLHTCLRLSLLEVSGFYIGNIFRCYTLRSHHQNQVLPSSVQDVFT